jgi:hypothetical protein
VTAADQSTGALLIIAALLVAATPVVAVMIGLEWWADRRRRPRYTRHPDDMPLVAPASERVRVWSPDMDHHETPAVRLIDARPLETEIVDCEAAGWVVRIDSVDASTITRAARGLS